MKIALTPIETAESLSLSMPTMRRLIADGTLPVVYFRGSPRITVKAIEAYIEKHEGTITVRPRPQK